MIIIDETKTFKEIFVLLCLFDNDFTPTLTERVGSLEIYTKKLFKYSNVFRAQIKQKTVGFVAIYMNDKIDDMVYIAQIAGRSNQDIKGVGTYLIEYIIDLAKKNNKKTIELEVHKENIKAINLYKKFNFKVKEEKKNCDFLGMVKNLDE